MAVYKVLQDVEAEDKLVGPLTLKGFIYAVAAGLLAFINFKLLITGGTIKWLFILLFLPLMVLFGVLASPLGRQQPTEVWLLARIKFMFKPRRRLWDQTGISKLVTITAPPKIEQPHTKGLSETEVKSRLQTLAITLDSRGWAIKNLSLPLVREDTDRLIAPTTTSSVAETVDIDPADDILDEKNNPTAQNFVALMEEADAARKLSVANELTQAKQIVANPAPSQKERGARPPAQEVTPQQKLGAPQSDYRLLRPSFATGQVGQSQMTDKNRADKLELAQSGSAFSVATVAKLANRTSIQQLGPNEVLISLHA
ncbi:hypothetical protein A3F65_02575 [Candidatus Saccharibacteria bacterium RIFCSPHIGHO2_12_FULL_47_16b]|nr:MAG: hypothetical protein A3F65_02575 [Candidatus Saccharibacteria bacterium RIFCSPHIGHO2_12_FULL_47_16b]